MTTYTTIANASLAVGGIPSSTTVTLLRDNPIAMAEAASGAPINAAGWHPVDKVTVGDGKDGKIYDSDINGTVASIITSDFVDGYEYMLFGSSLSHNSGSSQTVDIDLYHQTDAAYVTYGSSGTALTASDNVSIHVTTILPRLSRRIHMVNWQWGVTTSVNSSYQLLNARLVSTEQKILRARIKFSAGSIDSGKVWLFRRREFASSP